MSTTLTQVAGPTQTPAEIRLTVKRAIARSIKSGSFEVLPPSPELARALASVADRSEFGTDFYGQAPGRADPQWLVILADLDA